MIYLLVKRKEPYIEQLCHEATKMCPNGGHPQGGKRRQKSQHWEATNTTYTHVIVYVLQVSHKNHLAYVFHTPL